MCPKPLKHLNLMVPVIFLGALQSLTRVWMSEAFHNSLLTVRLSQASSSNCVAVTKP